MSVHTCETCLYDDRETRPECIRCGAESTPDKPAPMWYPRANVAEQMEAMRAENAALRAGLEWLRENGVCIGHSVECCDDGMPILTVHSMPIGQPRGKQMPALFYCYLAAATGQPALARLGAEESAPADSDD